MTTGVGVVGCGTISGAYLKTLTTAPGVRVLALADLEVDRARAQAQKFGVPQAVGVAELMAMDEIDLVIDLTIPAAHWDVNRQALEAGKDVYTEKPLAVNFQQAASLVALAESRGLVLGGAPDTFLGAGLQTVAAALEAGEIGTPFAAVAHMVSRGPESWHPDPAFLFAHGAGPLFDMGPYYVTAMVSLFGPVASVTAEASKAFPTRTIGSGPKAGQSFDVLVDTHVTLLLRFASGLSASLLTTFDVSGSDLPRFEIFGTTGTLSSPDPNTFGGPVRLKRSRDEPWRELPLGPGHNIDTRGLGALELIQAKRRGLTPRASGALAAHVIEVLEAAQVSASKGRRIALQGRPPQPRPMTLADYAELGWRPAEARTGSHGNA